MKTTSNGFNSAIIVISPSGEHAKLFSSCTCVGDDLVTVEVPDDWTIVSFNTERELATEIVPTVKVWHKTLRELAAVCGRQFTKVCTGMYYESACYTLTVS